MSQITVMVLSVAFFVLISVLGSARADPPALAQSTEPLKKSPPGIMGVMLLSCVASNDAVVVQAASLSGNAVDAVQPGENCAQVLREAMNNHCKPSDVQGSEQGAFYTLVCQGQEHNDDDDD
jgi:hypothetical protein